MRQKLAISDMITLALTTRQSREFNIQLLYFQVLKEENVIRVKQFLVEHFDEKHLKVNTEVLQIE